MLSKTPPSFRKRYQIIYADPPWLYNDRKGCNPKLGGFKYLPMSDEKICNLPIQNIAANNCALILWATMPKLPEALQVINAWGFKYITCLFNWVKLNPKGEGIYSGLGHWVNGNAELALFGKKILGKNKTGKPNRCVKNVKQIQMWPRGKHSTKPPQIREEIVRLFGDLPRIELFAREKTPGWDVWGNEVESDINLIGE